jgi:hypothetical protein
MTSHVDGESAQSEQVSERRLSHNKSWRKKAELSFVVTIGDVPHDR